MKCEKKIKFVQICTTLQWYESIVGCLFKREGLVRWPRNRTLAMKCLVKHNQTEYSTPSLQ